MFAHKCSIDKHFSLPINCSKMKQNILTSPLFRKCKSPLIPECVFFCNLSSHTRERRLHRKRNQNLALRLERICRSLGYCIIPKTIEIHPISTDHLRTRILRKRSSRIKDLSPWTPDIFSHRRPFLSRRSNSHR